uniref:RE1-silencing transcription factor n=1 Tax=Cacopsylla melanoneura TaxID=428564 RepID=A0A8D9BWA2_9HEMI
MGNNIRGSSVQYTCVHCAAFSTPDIDAMVSHCKSCPYMPRPDAYRCKYVCNVCTYGAYKIAAIKAHIFSHTGEKPFKCDFCDYACANKCSLSMHVRINH